MTCTTLDGKRVYVAGAWRLTPDAKLCRLVDAYPDAFPPGHPVRERVELVDDILAVLARRRHLVDVDTMADVLYILADGMWTP